MSEIERKGGILLSDEEVKNLLFTTTPGTVAEAISSALETADAIGEHEDSSHILNIQHHFIPTETFQTNEDKLFLSTSNNNNLINLDEDTGSLVSDSGAKLLEGNVNTYNGRASPFHEVHHNQNFINAADQVQYNRRKFVTREEPNSGSVPKDCGHHFLSSPSIQLDAGGSNHVSDVHEISSTYSSLFSSSSTRSSSSMASENKESGSYYCDNSRSCSDPDTNFRDKPDNREAHSVSHYKEKQATPPADPFESSARADSAPKPSSKVIELPDRSTSSSITETTTINDRNAHTQRHHHHHHHHHHRNKESKIPVGIAVAWQRLVTSSSVTPTVTPAMTTKSEGNLKQKSLNSSSSPSKYPSRPNSVSPISSKPPKSNTHANMNVINGDSNTAVGNKNNQLSLLNEARSIQSFSDRPLSAFGGEGMGGPLPMSPSSASPLNRPLPSSSVPPNMGFPVGSSYHSPYSLQGYHHRSSTPFLEYPYGSSPTVDRTFAIPSPLSSPHHHPHSPVFLGNGHPYWGGFDNSPVPILTSGIPSSPGAPEYLQLSMQQQMHFHNQQQQQLLATNRQNSLSISSSPYNPYLSLIYPHQDTNSFGSKNPYYDNYFHYQQNEMLRQQQLHHQQSNSSGSSANVAANNNTNNNPNNNGASGRSAMSSSSVVGGLDLLANNNTSTHHNRAVPMEVANSKTSIPLLSPSPTGGIRATPSPAASGAPLQVESAEISAAAETKTSGSGSVASTTISSSTITTQVTSHQSLSQSGVVSSSGELSSTYSSCSSASSPSPSFLLIHQQQHPHLFTSSSAALSPKSLTSSTPSPVTVHDFNSGLNVVVGSSANNNLTTSSSSNSTVIGGRKCATPSPVSLTPRALLSPFGSPFSPSPISNNNNGNYKDLVWKQEEITHSTAAKIKPIPINGHCNTNTSLISTLDHQNSAGSSVSTTPISSPLLHKRNQQLRVPTPLSSPNSHKHDFKRLESLIERRDSESISPLVLIPQHSPATSTTSSMLDGEEVRNILQGEGTDPERKINSAFILLKGEPDVDLEDKDRRKSKNEAMRLDTGSELDSNKEAIGSNEGIHSPIACSDNSDKVSFKVKERHTSQELSFQRSVVKVEKIFDLESESCAMRNELLLANKNTTISSCDVNKSNLMEKVTPSENQHVVHDDKNTVDDTIERKVVPESKSTLPISRNSSKNSSSDKDNISKYDDYFESDCAPKVDTGSCKGVQQSDTKQKQSTSVKHDISFTSGYSSANDDVDSNVRNSNARSKSRSSPKPKISKGKKEKAKSKLIAPSLKIKSRKGKDSVANKMRKGWKDSLTKVDKRKKKESTKGNISLNKINVKSSKIETPFTSVNADEKSKKKKKTSSTTEDRSYTSHVSELINDDFVLSLSNNNSIKKTNQSRNSTETMERKESGKCILKTPKRKDQHNKASPVVSTTKPLIHDSSQKSKKKKEKGDKCNRGMEKVKGKMRKGTKMELGMGDSHATTNSQLPISEHGNCSKTASVVTSSQYETNVSGDIIGSGSNSRIPGDNNNSLTISAPLDSIISPPPNNGAQQQLEQQPVALILKSSSSLQQTTLRIPAYIPRASNTTVGTETFSSVMTDELVGDQDNYNGPATLTLHSDVDALQQQQHIYYPQESQLPPGITIQYHHSAPATPLMPLIEATSPLMIKPEESSLNLLATVAQEFGSREDLGKRLSIDGSCNNSIVGESPPMSPMKSPGYPVTAQQVHQQQNVKSNIAPVYDNSREIINDVVRDVVDLYRNEKFSSDKLESLKKDESKINKKSKKFAEKTANSIIVKKKIPKAGKKEKRSKSDSGSYSQNVFLLKIPQVQRSIISEKSKAAKGRQKIARKEEDSKDKKLSSASPTTPLPETNLLKKKKREKTNDKEKVKNVKKSERNTASPEKTYLPTTTVSSSPLKLQDHTSSSKKDKVNKSPDTSSSSSCFHPPPPERISAFAKQVIARRDSLVNSGSCPTSPTKSLGNTSSTSQYPSTPSKTPEQFFRAMIHKHQLLCLADPNLSVESRSALEKMPQLTPFDGEQQSEVSKGTPSTLSLTTPPPLSLSISSSLQKAGLHSDHHSTKTPKQDKEKTDNTDTILVDGSRSYSFSSNASSKDMDKVKRKKKDKQNLLNDGKYQYSDKKMKARKNVLLSGEDETVNLKGKKKKSKKNANIPSTGEKKNIMIPSESSSRVVPKITVTSDGKESLSRQNSCSSTGNSAVKAFSPLTPPPMAKFPKDNNETETRELIYLNVNSTTPSSSHLSSPSNVEHEELEAETETENENDFNNGWVADPMFAVSAIKLSSNQTSDASSIGDDMISSEEIDDDDIRKRKQKRKSRGSVGSRPPKLSLYPKSTSQEELGSDASDQVQVTEGFLEVKSKLKAFTHFSSTQLTSNKKSQNRVKPSLNAESIERSQCEGEKEVQVDDDDFELDLEVATITTKNPSREKSKSKHHPNPGSATSSSSTSSKKQSINRNSLSYLSSSSTKQHHSSVTPLTTKEIMTKVFSRKVSPELAAGRRKKETKKRRVSETVEVKGDLLDSIEDLGPTIKQIYHHNAHASMCAAASTVIGQQSRENLDTSLSLSSSSQATATVTATSSPNKKSPQKRSARSSTTSSCASTKSSRGNRGQSSFSCSASTSSATARSSQENDETMCPGKVELDSVSELVDEMRILTEIQGLFYTGRLNALQPPDVYGVTLDNERGAPPHLIFSAEEVLEKCLREKKPPSLTSGLRICAYWSPQYSGLYPGRISTDFNPKFDPEEDLIPIEFDDGDTGMIKLKEIRLLSANHPVREYDPNPLLTLEKKHRKRRHSSATGTSGGCTGDHEEPDCGEPYCAKIGKLQEDDEDDDEDGGNHGGGSGVHQSSSKVLYWTWSGLGYKRPKNKKNRNKEFFHGIQRGEEAINVGDAALFISTGNERPFIGRVERFWECKGKKMVNVRWFYHPEEVKASAKRLSNLKYPGALFESPHIDENDVQTIAKKCDVLPFTEFKQRVCAASTGSPRLAKLSAKSSSKPRDMYYVAGFYDPYTYNLTLKDLK